MKKLVLVLVFLLVSGSGLVLAMNQYQSYMPMVFYNPATITPSPTSELPTPAPTITPTKPPQQTPIPDYPWNWLVPGSAINGLDGPNTCTIAGAKPSICHVVNSQKTDKTINLWVTWHGNTRAECEAATGNDYSHVPESHFPLPECLPPLDEYSPPPNIPCVCREFDQKYFCQPFKIIYPSNAKEVCAVTNGCIEVK